MEITEKMVRKMVRKMAKMLSSGDLKKAKEIIAKLHENGDLSKSEYETAISQLEMRDNAK